MSHNPGVLHRARFHNTKDGMKTTSTSTRAVAAATHETDAVSAAAAAVAAYATAHTPAVAAVLQYSKMQMEYMGDVALLL